MRNDRLRSHDIEGTVAHYAYDNAQQLLSRHAGTPSGPLLDASIYDANGQLTQRCQGGTVSTDGSTCSGDDVQTFAYDGQGQLIGAASSATSIAESYRYDHAGRRIMASDGTTVTRYVYRGDSVWSTHDWGWANSTHQTHLGLDRPLLESSANDATYFHADGLDSVVAESDPGGLTTAAALYDAWGNISQIGASGAPGRYGYTGREPNPNGLMYYRARHYDPSIGRFTQRDPAGFADGINLYSYVGNSPTNYTDPLGLSKQLARPGPSASSFAGHSGTGALTAASQPSYATGTRGQYNPVDALDGFDAIIYGSGTSKGNQFAFEVGVALITAPVAVPAAVARVAGAVLPALARLGTKIKGLFSGATKSTLQANKAAGAAFERQVMGQLQKSQSGVVQQVTVKTQSGVRTRLDMVGRDASGAIRCTECKASATAPLTKNGSSTVQVDFSTAPAGLPIM